MAGFVFGYAGCVYYYGQVLAANNFYYVFTVKQIFKPVDIFFGFKPGALCKCVCAGGLELFKLAIACV